MKRTIIFIIFGTLLLFVCCDKIAYLPRLNEEVTVSGNAVTFLFNVNRGNDDYMPKVEYDTDPNFLTSVVVTAEPSSDVGYYSVTLEGLQPYTTYYYRYIVSNSAHGSILVNNGDSFSTAEVTTMGSGLLLGRFSVSDTQKVYFSQGNLQYQASENLWRFADNQYDCIGEGNQNISESYNGFIDLFGWGTSGYSCGAICYQPWSTSTNDGDYGWNNSAFGFADLAGQTDWGYNSINNGGNQTDTWRTLRKDEWSYVFHQRNTASGVRFAKAMLNKVNGVLLLPDDWDANAFHLNDTNNVASAFSSNKISLTKWEKMEEAGAIFLPAAGGRDGNTLVDFGQVCYYWSSTFNKEAYTITANACAMAADNEQLFSDYPLRKHYGVSVRLVRSVEN